MLQIMFLNAVSVHLLKISDNPAKSPELSERHARKHEDLLIRII